MTDRDTEKKRQAFSWIAIVLKWLHIGGLEDGINLHSEKGTDLFFKSRDLGHSPYFH